MGFVRLAFVCALLAAACGQARAFSLAVSDLKVGGYVDGGRFQVGDTSVTGEVINRMGATWKIDKQLDDNWSILADLHWMFWRNQATDLALFHIAGIKFDSDMRGAFAYRSGANRFRLGLYDFKYNPDSKNLGEYLLRSEAYPTIIENSQSKDLLAWSHSRVAGAQYDLDLPFLRQTGLIYAEQYNVPVNDVSLAYLAAAGPTHAEVQLGAALHRQFRFGKAQQASNLDADLAKYIEDQGLSTQAVKLSLRGRLDLGRILESEYGPVFYAEAALLGLKSDTLFYKHLGQRVPAMAGIDLPTLGLLDLFSIEAEWFRNPYHGRKYSINDASGSKFSPLPSLNSDEYDVRRIPNDTQDDLKWSVLVQRSLNKWINVKARIASDHMRLLNWDGDVTSGEPMTKKTGDWYFLARIEYHN